MGSSSPLDDQELITLFPALATAALKHLLLGAKLPMSRPPGWCQHSRLRGARGAATPVEESAACAGRCRPSGPTWPSRALPARCPVGGRQAEMFSELKRGLGLSPSSTDFSHIAFLFLKYSFVYLAAPVLSCSTQDLPSSLCHARSSIAGPWELIPCPGIEPRPPALGMQS